jgi:hypothetical protein
VFLDPTVPALAKKRAHDAAEFAKQSRQDFEERLFENREVYEKFHNNLALFSGGTIALSVTFLGYLKSLPSHVVLYPKVLVASWVALFVCLISALFNSFFYSHYSHFGGAADYMSSLVKSQKVTADAMNDLEFENLTPQEKRKQQQKHRDIAEIYAGKQSSAKKEGEVLPLVVDMVRKNCASGLSHRPWSTGVLCCEEHVTRFLPIELGFRPAESRRVADWPGAKWHSMPHHSRSLIFIIFVRVYAYPSPRRDSARLCPKESCARPRRRWSRRGRRRLA